MELRHLLVGAGLLTMTSVLPGLPGDDSVIVLLGSITALGGLAGRRGPLLSAAASIGTLAAVWLAFDGLARGGRLREAGLGLLMGLLGGLAGTLVGLVAGAPVASPRSAPSPD